MPRKLRRLKLDRVDLVDSGANPGANITLFKHRTESPSAGTRRVHISAVPKETEKVTKTADELQAAHDAEMTESRELAAARLTEIEELRADVERTVSEADTDSAEVQKQLDDVTSRVEKTEIENAELRKADRVRTFIAKAKAYDLPEQIAPMLMEADEHFSEDSKQQFDGLLAQAKTEKLFAQLSDPGAEGEDAATRLQKAAKARVDEGLEPTIEQARVAAVEADSSLREGYERASV